MFLCCCTPSEDNAEVKPVGRLDEPSTDDRNSMSEEEVSTPGFPTAPAAAVGKTASAAPSLGTIDEEGDGGDAGGIPPKDQCSKGETFLVTLTRPALQSEVVESLFGVQVFHSEVTDSLEIIDVDQGDASVVAYHSSASKESRLEPGLLILAVNGVSDKASDMLAAWKDTLEVHCVVCRPMEFTVDVLKIDGGLGIDATHSTKGTSLLIEGIQAGPVQKWNRSNPDRKVKVGDRIVAVNGTRGSPTELKGALKIASGKVSLVIARRS